MFSLQKPNVIILLLALGLGGCAQIQSVQPGTPAAEVAQKFGDPIVVCRKSDGTERLIWTTQPMGQYAIGTDTNKDRSVGEIKQLLTDAHFEVLATGRWSSQQVLCEFGPPASVQGIAKGDERVWAYRYRQDSTWASLMYVYMGADGDHVTRFHPAPDPAYLGGNGRR